MGQTNKTNMHYKTNILYVTRNETQHQHSKELDIYIDGYKIKNVTKQTLHVLGIYIDENYNRLIISTIFAQQSHQNLSSHTIVVIPVEAQKLYYQGYILPLIDYGSCTWGTTSKANIERISKLQKRAANADYDTASFEMFNYTRLSKSK